MYRGDLSPRTMLLIAIMLLILWLGSCQDVSWLPDASYGYDS
jgi:hypothetical protein